MEEQLVSQEFLDALNTLNALNTPSPPPPVTPHKLILEKMQRENDQAAEE